MSDIFTVSPGEMRAVRVFHLDLPPEHIRFLRDEPGALADALGVPSLDATHLEILRLADLDGIGLSSYLADGADVSEAEIAPDRARLDALKGHALVLLSRAHDGRAETLTPRPGIEPVGFYHQVPTDWTAGKIASASATTPRPSPRQARSRARRIGGAIFTVVMLLVALILWLALR